MPVRRSSACSVCSRLPRPARFLMLVEDPGAANFAAGLLPVLQPHGTVTIYAKGEGAAQLARLGVNALALAEPFDAAALLAQTKATLVLVGTAEDKHAAAHDLVAACRAAHLPTLGLSTGRPISSDAFAAAVTAPLPSRQTRCWYRRRLAQPAHRRRISAGADFRCQAPAFRASCGRKTPARRHRPRRAAPPDLSGCPAGRPILVFLAERSDGLNGEHFRRSAAYTLAGRGGDDRRTNIVLEEVLDAASALAPRPYIVLRLHPKNDPQEFAAYSHEIDQVSRAEPALDVVYAADAVAGLTTILLSEAAVLGRPVLSVVPRASERDWLLAPPRIKILVVCDRSELLKTMQITLSGASSPLSLD